MGVSFSLCNMSCISNLDDPITESIYYESLNLYNKTPRAQDYTLDDPLFIVQFSTQRRSYRLVAAVGACRSVHLDSSFDLASCRYVSSESWRCKPRQSLHFC